MSHPPASLAIYLLGPARLERNGKVVEVETRKAIALLAYLALHPERLSRDQLAAFFWPEHDQERAYANLRRTLWALNKALGDGWLTADNLTLELRQQETLWIDVVEFQRLLAQCRDHGHRSDEVCPACLVSLGQAVSLVRGDFLEGFSLRDSAAFDDWHFFEAESLRKQVAVSLEKLVQGHSNQQEDETAIGYARRWLALDPLHEPVHRWLMQLYAWTGQPTAAARQYQECVRVLKAELDAPPEAETTALYNRIRSKQIARRSAHSSPAPSPSAQPEAGAVEAIPAPPVKEIVSAPTPAGEDELRMVTVLCAALTEPLAATPTYPSEQSAQRMKRIFQVAEEILLRYDGRVERILSEGVVAIFGSHQLHEDDPERAVRAALELRQAAQGAGWQMSVGISSGHVYRSGQGAGTTTIGPVVNLALRLQSKADSDQLLVSEATYRQTRGVAVYTPLPVALQSSAAPLQVYQIERLQPQPQKVRGIAGLHAPLVGRSKELATLQEALAAVQNGAGQFVTLIGDAGVGKSRLVSELKTPSLTLPQLRGGDDDGTPQSSIINRQSSILWLEGRCLEMAMSASYWPFLDMLRVYLAWQPEEAETNRARRIVTALDALVTRGTLTAEQREEMGPLLGNLLAVRFGNDWDERLKFAGPEQIRHQTLVTLRDFFVALSNQEPVVLVLEDLHWADSLSLDLITLLMEKLAEQPLLLLCVYRPEQQHRCWQLAALAAAKCPDHFTEVRLRELTTKQSQQLVEGLLTIENLAPKVKATILQKAQGNPLFVEEVIRSLIDAGIVYRQDEVWQAKEEIENVVVPETVQSVILSRVDRLGEGLKGILQRAAVIGRVFGRRLLSQLVPPGLDLDNAISALTNHALIYQERVVPEEEYSFKHVLVQEAIYQTTLAERREEFHRQVGEALEQLYADNLAERYEQLAYHYERSGVVTKAIEYLLKAGEKARRAYLNEEAIRYFQRAQERLAEQRQVADQVLGEIYEDWRLAALRGLGQTNLGIGKMAEAEGCFRQAIALRREMKLAPRELVRLYHWLGEVLWWQSRHDEQIQTGEEGLALLGDDTESVEAALMNSNIAWGYYFKGDLAKARAYTLRYVPFIQLLPHTEELGPAYIRLIIIYAEVDKNVDAAMRWAETFSWRAKQHHDLTTLGDVYEHLAWDILVRIGDLRGAVSYFQKSLELFTKIGNVTHTSKCLLAMGVDVFLPLGDLHKAEDHVQSALAILQNVGHAFYVARLQWVLGIISLCRGLPERATNAFNKARQLFKDLSSLHEVRALIGLGQVNLVLANRKESLQLFQKVLSLTRSTDNSYWQRPLVYALSGLEEVYDSADSFRTFCRHLQVERPDLKAGASVLISSGKRIANRFVQWFLEPAQPDFRFGIADLGLPHDELQNLNSKIQKGEWAWHDQFNDCSFTLHDGLDIQATNGRDLAQLNLSAPRLLRPVTGDFAVQMVCLPVSDEKPAQGGILLWKDKENYLRLDRGAFGKHEITLLGCLDNNDVIIGRGRLPSEHVFLRLERVGERVNALCSADGEQWCTVGHVDFPVADPLKVGMHAIGQIDRLIYPGAYPDGTAIRFESFALYRPLTA